MSYIVKKTNNLRYSTLIPAVMMLLGVATACNSKDDKQDSDDPVVTSSTVAVRNFSLKADSKVASNLDTVFFSIDLNNGVIFNADSLPKGADISKLVPVITFASSMSQADIVVKDEDGTEIQNVNYLTNKNDSIDFSKNVSLLVKSYDETNTFTYRLKVNVHKQNPDSIGWELFGHAALPSRLANPKEQKTVMRDGIPFSLIRESDNSYTFATATDIFNNTWAKRSIFLPFNPDVASLTASASTFYLLSNSGNLYTSTDGVAWRIKSSGWQSLIGLYNGSTLLGIKEVDGTMRHASLVNDTEIVGAEIPGDFPIKGRSQLCNISNKWAELPMVFFVGGECRNGTLSGATWAFDGTTWAVISNAAIPAAEGLTVVKYTMFRYMGGTKKAIDFDAWIAIGGHLADGSFNRTLYTSLDNGVSWHPAAKAMQLPEDFPDVAGADAIIGEKKLNSDLADAWTPSVASSLFNLTRAFYEIDGTEITWDCPYIFVIGGMTPSGTLSPEIWRGVLTRLRFTPLI